VSDVPSFCQYTLFCSATKAKEVTKNPRISVLIDTDKPTQAVLLEGEAEVLTEPSEVSKRSESIYARYVGEKEVREDPYQAWAHDPENRIIKLRPSHVYKWNW
jgi:general stress protein 26